MARGTRRSCLLFHFERTPVLCPNCGAALDWWATVLREIRENFMRSQAYAPISSDVHPL